MGISNIRAWSRGCPMRSALLRIAGKLLSRQVAGQDAEVLFGHHDSFRRRVMP
jgi:hypothetical protein